MVTFNHEKTFRDLGYGFLKKSSIKEITIFKKILMNKGYITTLRVTRGDAVDGACGQLVGKLSKSVKGKKLISHQLIS